VVEGNRRSREKEMLKEMFNGHFPGKTGLAGCPIDFPLGFGAEFYGLDALSGSTSRNTRGLTFSASTVIPEGERSHSCCTGSWTLVLLHKKLSYNGN